MVWETESGNFNMRNNYDKYILIQLNDFVLQLIEIQFLESKKTM